MRLLSDPVPTVPRPPSISPPRTVRLVLSTAEPGSKNNAALSKKRLSEASLPSPPTKTLFTSA